MVHHGLNHQEISGSNLIVTVCLIRVSLAPHFCDGKVSIGMVGSTISTPRLNALLRLHLEPINLVISEEVHHV